MKRRSLIPALALRQGSRPVPAMLLAVALVALVSGSALAAPPVHQRQAQNVAQASASDCIESPDGSSECYYASLGVFQTGKTTELCLLIGTTFTAPDGSTRFREENGCRFVSTSQFRMDTRKLNSASLSTVTVQMAGQECEELETNCVAFDRDVTIAARWTGTGAVERFSNKVVTSDETCTITYKGKGETRQATATLTLDGEALPVEFADLLASKTAMKVTSACTL